MIEERIFKESVEAIVSSLDNIAQMLEENNKRLVEQLDSINDNIGEFAGSLDEAVQELKEIDSTISKK